VWVNNVKHVIDLTPCTNLVAVDILDAGGSYYGLCASDIQKDWMFANIKKKLIAVCKDPTTNLHGQVRRPESQIVTPKAIPAVPRGRHSNITGARPVAAATTGAGAGVPEPPTGKATAAAKASGTPPAVAAALPMDIGGMLAAAKVKLAARGSASSSTAGAGVDAAIFGADGGAGQDD
jgi:hypothetical protein